MSKLLTYGTTLLLGVAMASPALASRMYVHDSAGMLGIVDTTTGATDIIGDLGVLMTDIAFDPDGNLFGISFYDLYSIDPTTASSTLIGAHGVSGGNGLVFGSDGTLYASGDTSTHLFSLDLGTGAGTSLGNMGFASGGDLAFVGSDLFLSSNNDKLVSVDLDNPENSFAVGGFGVSDVYGIATDENSDLFGVAGTMIYAIDPNTGDASAGVSFAGGGLGQAYGQSFFAEAGADPGDDPNPPSVVPLPASGLLLFAAALSLAATGRYRRK